MTIWDKIYRKYLSDGQEYATLSKDLIPEFLKFISTHEFPERSVLDLGCGNGKYLAYLKEQGFKTDGIDSSPTAVEIAKKKLGNGARIWTSDMYSAFVPTGPYGLVISIAAIHHGLKRQVGQAVSSLYQALLPGGYAFVTLPDNGGMNHWTSMAEHQEIEPGTRVPLTGPEAGLPHSSYMEPEIRELFKDFSSLELMLLEERGRWIVIAKK